MKQPYYKKYKALKLKNDGLNNVEISKLTGVSEKGIAVWIKNWIKADKEKNETILSIHKKIQELTKLENCNSFEILELTQSIEILQGQLLLKSKFINL